MAFKPIKLFAGRPDVKPFDEGDYKTPESNFIYYHNSNHKFEPGDIIDPTMSIYQASLEQGMYKEDIKDRDRTPHAWAAGTPDYMKTYGRYTYEVEPISRHSWVNKDPVGFENGEFASPEGYRVRQMVWDQKKDFCSSCRGYGYGTVNSYADTKCTDCFETGLSTSKIASLQKTGLSLEEIKKYRPEL